MAEPLKLSTGDSNLRMLTITIIYDRIQIQDHVSLIDTTLSNVRLDQLGYPMGCFMIQ